MEDEKGFYTGARLLTYKDLNGNKPMYLLCTSNRSAGKTFYFSSDTLRNFKRTGAKFVTIFRHEKELSKSLADEFFGHICFSDEFSHDEMNCRKGAEGVFWEYLLNGKPCGYAVSLNKASVIRKKAPLFSNVQRILFDEFQTEDNRYLPDEIGKLLSVQTSIARGFNNQNRFIQVVLLGNTFTILNPYFQYWGISARLKHNTKFLRGVGWVLEQDYNKRAYEAMKESGMLAANEHSGYMQYAAEGKYINDSTAFIGKPEGKGVYICTIKHNDTLYGIRDYERDNLLYMDRRADESYPIKLAVSVSDHAAGYQLFGRGDYVRGMLRTYFHQGAFRFSDVGAKAALIEALSY